MPDIYGNMSPEEERMLLQYQQAQAMRAGQGRPQMSPDTQMSPVGMVNQSAMTPEQRAALQSRANYNPETKEAQYAALLRGGQDAVMNTGAAKGKTIGDIYVAPTWSEIAANAVKQGVGGYQMRQGRQGLDKAAAGRRDAEEAQGSIDAEDFRIAKEQQAIENQQDADAVGTQASQFQQTLDSRTTEGKADRESREAIARAAAEAAEARAAEVAKARVLAAEVKATTAKDVRDERADTAAQKVRDKTADASLEKLGALERADLQLGYAEEALADGAYTGPIAAMLPSFRGPSVKLDNARDNLALEKIGEFTFGSLSEAEGDWLKGTSIPEDLEEDELETYLSRRREGGQRAIKAEKYRIMMLRNGHQPDQAVESKIKYGPSEKYPDGFTFGAPK